MLKRKNAITKGDRLSPFVFSLSAFILAAREHVGIGIPLASVSTTQAFETQNFLGARSHGDIYHLSKKRLYITQFPCFPYIRETLILFRMKRGIFLVVLMLSAFGFSSAQVTSVSQAQSMFIYNFSRLIQWPAGSSNGEFIIGVIGDTEMFTSLTAFVTNKKVGNLSISVKKFDDTQNITRCNILFVGDAKIGKLGEVISKIEGSNSLIITERKGMINSGSAIDFFMDQDKLKFVINADNAEKYNLIVSKSLEDMAYKN